MDVKLLIVEPPTTSQAEYWYARLHAPDCSRSERDAFSRWLAEHPGNEATYAEVGRIYGRSAELRSDPAILAALNSARVGNGVSHRWRRVSRLAIPFAAAAMIMLAIGLHLQRSSQHAEKHYETGVGEQRSEILADGSTVLLDTSSAISVRISGDERHVSFERGRVQFQIVHDPKRPFVVDVGKSVIRDIGTQFQVRTDADSGDVAVTLLEGAVSVSLPLPGTSAEDNRRTEALAPGQQLVFDQSGKTWSKHSVDLTAARGWTQGDLVFENRPLGELVAEMNRYTTTRILLGDPALKSIPISGVFHEGDQQSLLLALRHGWSLDAKRSGENDIVLYRSQN